MALLAEQVNTNQQAAATAVSSVIATEGGSVQAARFASQHAAGGFEDNLARASAIGPSVARVVVHPVQADTSKNVLPEGFSYSAPTQLVLFVFINALAGGAAIIETRRLGMFERMSAAPIRPASIIAGEALTYAALALLQSVIIVLVGGLAFGVSWGNPLGATLLVLVWSLVGAGAGMLSGTVFRTAEQAGAVGAVTGIVLGMLGGCMWPLSIVSSTIRAVGHVTPQSWAVDAWTTLLFARRDGGVHRRTTRHSARLRAGIPRPRQRPPTPGAGVSGQGAAARPAGAASPLRPDRSWGARRSS